jgi:hypothetical protein
MLRLLCLLISQAQALVHEFSPQEISNLLWAYAKLGVQPPHMLLVALWESVGIGAAASSSSISSSGSSGGGFGSSGGSSSGSSGGTYGSSSGSVGARLSAFKPQELAMLVWALAVLKLVPGANREARYWGCRLGTYYDSMLCCAHVGGGSAAWQPCGSSVGNGMAALVIWQQLFALVLFSVV